MAAGVTVAFSEEVPSDQRVLNPLGIQHHLDYQTLFLPGITSVTYRARYYTLQAWYYQNLYDDRVATPKDFERIFILACLAHHDGDYSHPALERIHNKQRFAGEWDTQDKFDLNFNITGYGRGYYISQLETFRCAWTDKLDRVHRTRLNQQLADSIDLPTDVFAKDSVTKGELRYLSEICPCNKNQEELEVLSKLFFGFIRRTDSSWDIDTEGYDRFQHGEVELAFDEELADSERALEARVRESNLRRRNTLFLFLKIISETTPTNVRRAIRDALYFSANRITDDINFVELERIRRFWEFFQLNVYYVFALESLLDVLQRIIRNNPGIEQERLLAMVVNRDVTMLFEGMLDREPVTIGDVLSSIEVQNGTRRTTLDSPVNESDLYERIAEATNWQEKAAFSLLMLLTLKFRYDKTPEVIRNQVGEGSETQLIRDDLNIHRFFEEVDERKEVHANRWFQDLVKKVKHRHLFEAASRFSSNGTRCWLFTGEDGRLFYARQKPISIHPRDNRWDNVESLLTDLRFVDKDGDRVVLTEKGERWIQKVT